MGGGAKNKTPASGSGTPQRTKEDIPRVDLTVQALMQLDRRLSISRGKMQDRRSKGKQRALAPVAAADESDEDFDIPAGRINATAEAESDDPGLEELPVYCFQHAKQTMDQKGIFVGSKYLDFEGSQKSSDVTSRVAMLI